MNITDDNVNQPDENGFYPVHRVVNRCERADPDALLAVIASGARLDVQTPKGRTALHLACYAGQYHLVKILVEHGASVHIKDETGLTPMHMAVEGSNSSIFVLARAGANLDEPNNSGMTPLMLACALGKVGAVKNLCELGANTNIDEYSPVSLVYLAVDSFKGLFASNALQLVRVLLKHGATAGQSNLKTGETALHRAARRTKEWRANDQFCDLMRVLIRAGADPWGANHAGETPLSVMRHDSIAKLAPALKAHIKGKELAIVTHIRTIEELKAFHFNQNKLTKGEVYQLLKEGTPAKEYFAEALALPPMSRDTSSE